MNLVGIEIAKHLKMLNKNLTNKKTKKINKRQLQKSVNLL